MKRVLAFAAIWLSMIAAAICAQSPPGGYGPGSGGSTTVSPSVAGGLPFSVSASPTCTITSSVAGNTCQFVYDDGYAVATDVTTNSSTTITCPNNDCNFTTITQPQFGSTIVGMQAWVTQTSAVASSPVPVCPISAITGVSAQSITVTTTCTGNLTAAGTLYIGHKDTTNLSKAWTTAGCGTLTLPALSANPIAKAGSQAVMLVDSGEFNSQPTSCSAAGTTGFYGSPSLYGTPVSTTLLMTPDFPFTTGACTGVASAGITGSYNVCFGPGPVIWYGVDVVGAGFASCGTAALVLTSAGAGGAMQYSNHNNVCTSNANLIGTLLYSADYRFLGGGIQNVGGVAVRAPASAGFPVYTNTALLVNDQAGSGNTDIGMQVDSGAFVIDHGSNIDNNLINGTFIGSGTMHMSFNGTTGQNASAQVGATGYLDCTACSFNNTVAAYGSPGNSSVGLYLHNSGAKAALRSTTSWQGAPAGGFAFFTVAGTVYTDDGGNAGPTANGGTSVSVSGNIINEASSANNLPVAGGNLVLSAGWGSTAAVSALSGGNSPIKFTITNSGTGQAANPTIAYTFPNGFFVAPYSCTATQIGGTNASLAPYAASSLTANGVTFTATGTPTASSTEIIQVQCVTP